MSPRLTLVIASLTLAVSAAGDVWAGPPADQVRLQIDRVVDVLTDPALKAVGRERERQAAVRRIAEEVFEADVPLANVASMQTRGIRPGDQLVLDAVGGDDGR